VAWPRVCAPKEHGGLGVKDLRTMGLALRLRWEWWRRTDPSKCWVDFPAPMEASLVDMWDASVTVTLGDGNTALFWLDNWLPEGPIKLLAPHLFRAVGTRVKKRRKVAEALVDARWFRDIMGPVTPAVLRDCLRVWNLLHHVRITHGVPDKLVWRWEQSAVYSSSSHTTLSSSVVLF
jgi:hypothetical protein